MVTLNFKLTERGTIHFPLSAPQKLDTVLQQCIAGKAPPIGGYIAVRSGKVITGKSLIEDEDVIDIFPPLSGG